MCKTGNLMLKSVILNFQKYKEISRKCAQLGGQLFVQNCYFYEKRRINRRVRTIQQKTTESSMFLGFIKSGKADLVVLGNQNARKIMSCNFDFINKPICFKRDVLWAFEANISTELFLSN